MFVSETLLTSEVLRLIRYLTGIESVNMNIVMILIL